MRRGPMERDERGMALVSALLVLFTLSLLAVVLMMTVNTETKIAGNGLRASQSLNVAEAGVGEVCSRINAGDISLATANPNSVAQIFLVPTGSVPTPGSADTSAMETRQPSGAWLTYSTPGKGPDVLTCEFKKNSANQILYYNPSVVPPVNTVSGMPIYKVTSTGRIGGSKAKIVTEITRRPVVASIQGALQANVGIDFKGNIDVCGYNHTILTPYGTKAWAQCSGYHSGVGDLPAGWSTNTITKTGSAAPRGNPDWRSENNTGFFAGPWESLGMSAAEFWSWIGPPQTSIPDPPDGLLYIDSDGLTQNGTTSAAIHGGTGEGMIYVDGDLHINGNFQYKGLIYVEGDLDINGTCWILGGIIVKGVGRINCANGNASLLYSSDAIMQALSRAGGSFLTLSWRQL